MVSTAFSVLHNREDAEDTVHETFIRIAKNMKSIDNPMSERTLSYVIKATKNNAINLLNKNNKEKWRHCKQVNRLHRIQGVI